MELGGHLLLEEAGGGLFVPECAGHMAADVGDETGAEADGRVVVFDGILDA